MKAVDLLVDEHGAHWMGGYQPRRRNRSDRRLRGEASPMRAKPSVTEDQQRMPPRGDPAAGGSPRAVVTSWPSLSVDDHHRGDLGANGTGSAFSRRRVSRRGINQPRRCGGPRRALAAGGSRPRRLSPLPTEQLKPTRRCAVEAVGGQPIWRADGVRPELERWYLFEPGG